MQKLVVKQTSLYWYLSICIVTVIAIQKALSVSGTAWLRYVGDDLFYYFSVVEVFSREGILSASVDPSAKTNGFHVIWFLVILIVRKVFQQDVWGTISIIVSLNLLLWTGTVVFLRRIISAFGLNGAGYIVPLVIFLSPTMRLVCFGGLEGPLFTFLFTGTILRLNSQLRKILKSGELRRIDVVINLLILTALVLSRTEGLILAALFVLVLSLVQRTLLNRTMVYWTGICLFWLICNRIVFGNISQSSTLFYTTYFRPRSSTLDLLKSFRAFFDFTPDLIKAVANYGAGAPLTVVGITVLLIFIENKRDADRFQYADRLTVFTALVAVLVSSAYFSFVQGTPSFARYRMSAYVVFGMLIAAAIGQFDIRMVSRFSRLGDRVLRFHKDIFQRLSRGNLTRFLVFAVSTLTLLSFSGEAVDLIDQVGKQAPDERAMFVEAGQRVEIGINTGRIDGSLSGLNTGIMGYFSGQKILNVDGRVNSEIFDHGAEGGAITSIPELHRYLKSKKVKYFIDGYAVPINHMMHDYNASHLCVSLFLVYERNMSNQSPWYGGIGLFKIAEEIPEACLEPL